MGNIYDIVIIGAGPAGIAAAVEASVLGIKNSLILEKGQNHSATIRQFYKEKKRVDKDWMGQKTELYGNVHFIDGTKESTLDYFDELLTKHGLEAKFGEEAERVEKMDELLIVHTTQGLYKAKSVIVAIGKMGKPNKPPYEIPAPIRHKVNYDLDRCSKDESILVVGGGNSAAEYAYDLADTNDVALCYRQKNFTRLNAQNLLNINRYSSHGKIRMLMGTNINALEERDGKIVVHFDEIAHETFDRIIYAIGGTTPVEFLRKCGIELQDGSPTVDENLETNVKGIYVSGDLGLNSGGSIAMALNMSFTIVHQIKKVIA